VLLLPKLFGPKRYEVTGQWRKLHNDELNDLYSTRTLNSREQIEKNEIGGHVARMEKRDVHTGFWWGNLRERDHLEDPRLDGKIILRWIVRKWDVGGMDWTYLAEDRDKCRALVKTVMNLQAP